MENKSVKWKPCSACKYNNTCGSSDNNPRNNPCKGWEKAKKEER